MQRRQTFRCIFQSSALQGSQEIIENHNLTNRQTNLQTNRVLNRNDEAEIQDEVINMEHPESSDIKSISDRNLPPPSYNEVMKSERDLTSPPPTYSELIISSQN